MWLFIVLILTSSYTARLSALLTVDKLDDFKISKDHYVGYQQGSFVREFLVTNLHLNDSKLRGYTTIEQYHHAMAKGGKQGGIDAIVDEIPYVKLFLHRYGSQYKRVGPTYKSGGFGFVSSSIAMNCSSLASITRNLTGVENLLLLFRHSRVAHRWFPTSLGQY